MNDCILVPPTDTNQGVQAWIIVEPQVVGLAVVVSRLCIKEEQTLYSGMCKD